MVVALATDRKLFLLVMLITAVKCIDYSAYDIVKLSQLTTKCIKTKFKSFPQCEATRLVENFDQQVFNFNTPSEVERYAEWLKFMNKMQEYDAQIYLLDSVAKHSLSMARINTRISRKMQIVSEDVFILTANLYSRYATSANFRRTFVPIQSLFDTFVIWDPAQFTVCLAAYANVREKFEKNMKIVEIIDRAAVQLSKIALTHPLMVTRPQNEIKQDIYMYYVSKFTTDIVLANDETKFKKNMYENIEKVLFFYEMSFRMNNLTVHIYHNITRPETLLNMRQVNDQVYNNFKSFYQHLNLDYTHRVLDIYMYVHNKKKNYVRTGPYWNFGVENGGITQYMYSSKTIRSNVFFVDYEQDSLPNAYGHEFHHCLLFTLESHNQPKWFIEGSADRFGNPECYARAHEGLKAHRNTSITDIVQANYQSNILYPMGTALVAYLYEMRPSLLRSMIIAENYTFEINSVLERDFDLFKKNQIDICNHKIALSTKGKKTNMNSVQQQYMKMIDEETFKNCQNYIQVDFDDCAFILTPQRLIKQNRERKSGRILAQKEIRFNFESVSQFDFEYLQKGMVKLAIKNLMPVDYTDPLNILEKYFSIDNSYWYNGQLSCRNDSMAIVRFARLSKFWLDLPMNNGIDNYLNTTLQQDVTFITNLIEKAESCRVFIPPPYANTSAILRDFTSNVKTLRYERISPQNLAKPLDAHNNTLMHLVAMYNHEYFSQLLKFGDSYRQLVVSLFNLDKHTPLNIYYYSKNFLKKFNRMPSQYCFTYLKLNYSGSNLIYKPVQMFLTSTTVSSTVVNTPEKIGLGKDNVNETIVDRQEYYYIVITSIVIMVVGCIVLILLNIAIKLIVLKVYNKNRKKKLTNRTKNSVRQKYYTSDECIVRLFD